MSMRVTVEMTPGSVEVDSEDQTLLSLVKYESDGEDLVDVIVTDVEGDFTAMTLSYDELLKAVNQLAEPKEDEEDNW